MPVGKEAMTAESFDEDDYAANLVDKEGYSEVTARMLAKKKKESFEAKKIEIDLGSLAKAKKRVWVKPTATKKGYYREQEVGLSGERLKSLRYTESKLAEAEKRDDKENISVLKDWIKKLKSGSKVDLTEAPSGYGRKVSGLKGKPLFESQKRVLFAKSDDEEIEHLSPEERKKRQKDRDKRQKERAVHRAVRRKQHEEVEAGIPAGE